MAEVNFGGDCVSSENDADGDLMGLLWPCQAVGLLYRSLNPGAGAVFFLRMLLFHVSLLLHYPTGVCTLLTRSCVTASDVVAQIQRRSITTGSVIVLFVSQKWRLIPLIFIPPIRNHKSRNHVFAVVIAVLQGIEIIRATHTANVSAQK